MARSGTEGRQPFVRLRSAHSPASIRQEATSIDSRSPCGPGARKKYEKSLPTPIDCELRRWCRTVREPVPLRSCRVPVERSHKIIRPADTNDSIDRAPHRIRKSNPNLLLLFHQVLYKLIRVAGDISASELHERYENSAEQLYVGYPQTPNGKVSNQSKLSKHRLLYRIHTAVTNLAYRNVHTGGTPKR